MSQIMKVQSLTACVRIADVTVVSSVWTGNLVSMFWHQMRSGPSVLGTGELGIMLFEFEFDLLAGFESQLNKSSQVHSRASL
jgi:hypothetical protein